jgi:hypothetical protein
MRKLGRFRPSPALVISLIALFVAMGGIGYAAAKITTSDIKNGAVTTKKLHNKAVSTKKIKNNAVTGAKAKESSFGQVPDAAHADNANNLGGTPASGYQQSLRWAVVSANASGASVVRGNATAAGRVSPGNYFVSFQPDIRNCSYVATDGDTGAGFGPAGEISVEQRNASNATDVEVRHFNSAGAPTDYGTGDGFHIVVVC